MSTQFQTAWHGARKDEGNDGCRVLGEAVREEAVRLLAGEHARSLRAVILTGSLARDEATVITEEDCWKCLGDAEFLLVFDERTPMPTSRELEPLLRQIEAQLERRNIFCHVVAGVCRASALSRFRPSIFAYELRTQGQVVWGDPRILCLLRDYSASEIPREDAWCMLSNRMIEQLEFADELSPRTRKVSLPLFYRVVKLYLDMATSLLVFAGTYRPTYRERAEQLELLANGAASAREFPIPLREFAERVRACTCFKLQEHPAQEIAAGQEMTADAASWKEALVYARQLWRWELEQLTGLSNQLSDRELLERWMQLQPVSRRVRGWLYVLRARGWHRSWRDWGRWLRLALRCSPRYCIYAAASELFFLLPVLLSGTSDQVTLDRKADELMTWLPVTSKTARTLENSDWQQVASEIVRNYKELLLETQT